MNIESKTISSHEHDSYIKCIIMNGMYDWNQYLILNTHNHSYTTGRGSQSTPRMHQRHQGHPFLESLYDVTNQDLLGMTVISM